MRRTNEKGLSLVGWLAVAAAVALVIVFVVPAITNTDTGQILDPNLNTEEEAVQGEAGVTVEEILNNSSQYMNQTVTVTGNVGQTISNNGFTMDEEGLNLGQNLLVISAQPMMNEDGSDIDLNDSQVTVTGTVREFRLQDMETELGRDLEDELFSDYEGRPVVVAREVQVRS